MSWVLVGAAVVTAFSAVKQGQAQSAAAQSEANMAEYNAQMADIQAKQAYASAGTQEDLQRKRARAAIGNQLAAGAESGAGLNTDQLRASLYDAETDALAIRYEGGLKAQGMSDSAALQRSSAAVSRDRASRATSGGYLNAAASVLNTGANYYSRKK